MAALEHTSHLCLSYLPRIFSVFFLRLDLSLSQKVCCGVRAPESTIHQCRHQFTNSYFTNQPLSEWGQTSRQTHRRWTGKPDRRLYRRRRHYNTAASYCSSRRQSGLSIDSGRGGGGVGLTKNINKRQKESKQNVKRK